MPFNSVFGRLKKKLSRRPDPGVIKGHGSLHGSEYSALQAEPSEPRTNRRYGLFAFETDITQHALSGAERFPVDIIAVHGLGGDAYKTWTHQPTGKLWLRDFLPAFLPGCRVYTFGYPAKLHDVNVSAGVQDFAYKLLSSVRDHMEDSTDALVYAHEDRNIYGEILQCTLGVVFLATPHRGSDTANLGNIFYTIANTSHAIMTAGLRPPVARIELLEYLTRNSKALQSLIGSSSHLLKNLSIVTFYENIVTPSISSLIVDRASAELGIGNEDVLPLWEDHRSICRYESENSESYRHVARAIRRIARQSHGQTSNPTLDPTPRRVSTHSSNMSFTTADMTCVTLINDADIAQDHLSLPKPVAGTCQWIHNDRTFLDWLGNMVSRHRSMIAHVRRVYELHGQGLVQSFSHLWSLFLRILQDPKAGLAYVILDALDESRLAIDEGQPGYAMDLKKFIRQRVDEISETRKFSREVTEYLYESISTKAGRTFLWIHIVLPSLEQSLLTSNGDLKRILNNIPDDLANIYKRYLSSITADRQAIALRFLQLIVASSRALHLEELNIAFTISQTHMTVDDTLQELQGAIAHTVQSTLGPLIRISEMHVSFVHQTVKEFLLTETLENLAFPALRALTEQSSALYLASACIQYLAMHDFQADLYPANHSLTDSSNLVPELDELPFGNMWDNDNETLELAAFYSILETPVSEEACDTISSAYKFYSYAALHWAEHFAACEEVAPAELLDAAKFLLNADNTCCVNWLNFYCTKRVNLIDDDSFGRDSIVLASQFNASSVLKALLDAQEPSQDTKDRSLYWAARLGHERIVPILLGAGADPNSHELEQHTALTVASEQGRVACVAALLADARTDTSMVGLGGRNALSFACGGGHDGIVRQLLGRLDCKSDEPDYSGTTPLLWAAGGGHFTTLSILARQASTNINHRDKQGRTALSWAAGDGKADILNRLLSMRAIDVNARDKNGRSPLSWAAGQGQMETVEALLNTAAVDKASVDCNKRSVLSWASGNGHAKVLERLLDSGCPGADTQDIDGWPPLLWSIHRDSPDTVQVLIDSNQVQLNYRDRGGRSALDWAIESNYTNAANALLRAGAVPRSDSKPGP
ncbi:hypothetical protein NLG97_g8298 [Lecanicillium saksenae]|uniref:Uncharacterized protein n=1 Tax=Lecanicillium saksenae TaxID=468837 RepID=A0ACC1QLY7_9HYPO|nr:hypothetical protein NLG97_g8298 [Lecanicillium saksenae]